MYLSHYNLTEKPFQISTDPKFLWLGEKHREALAVLKYGIINNQGFILLTGDVGTGKTTLINALVNSLGDDTIVAVVSDPKLDTIEFFNHIANSFKIKKIYTNKLEFITHFGQFLRKAHELNKKILLVIDEAQNVSVELLEEIRLLSNIEMPERKLLNVFFVGQNEFNKILMRTQCRALRQRITITYDIESLTENETGEYIKYRLNVAGASNEIFNNKTIRKIYAFSQGYPRLINIICDQALLTGYVKDFQIITPAIIKECKKELSLPGELNSAKQKKLMLTQRRNRKLKKRVLVYSCLLFLTMFFAYYVISTRHQDYLIEFKKFYGHLFQQYVTAAYSQNTQNQNTAKPREIRTAPPSSQIQENSTNSQPTAADPTEGKKHATSASIDQPNKGEQGLSLEDFNLVIPFDYKSNEVPESAYKDLNRIAVVAMEQPDVTLFIKGYSDNVGSRAYNKQLSGFRANIVKSYFVGQGLSPTRIRAIAMGEENALESNRTEEGRKANRRVEVEIRGQKSEDR